MGADKNPERSWHILPLEEESNQEVVEAYIAVRCRRDSLGELVPDSVEVSLDGHALLTSRSDVLTLSRLGEVLLGYIEVQQVMQSGESLLPLDCQAAILHSQTVQTPQL